MVTFRYRGREIHPEDILYVRALIEQHPTDSRRKLSTRLCEAWDWRQSNGALRDMVCRGLLLMLERAGQIALPPVTYKRHNPLAQRSRPAPVLLDQTPIEARLKDIGPVEFEQVRRTADEPLFNSLMEEHHYLGYEQPVGEHLKYLVWAQGRPIACLAWSSAPRHLGSRDRYIGWSAEARRPEHPLSRLQHAIPDSALGEGGASGFPHPRPHGGADQRRLATDVRTPDLFSGDVHRPGTIPRNLLPGGELGGDGQDDRARQAIQQPRAEPVDQRGSGIPGDQAFSGVAGAIG